MGSHINNVANAANAPYEEVNSTTFLPSYEQKRQCALYTTTSGEKWYIQITMPPHIQKEDFYDKLPLYSSNTFLNAPDGIYTWILTKRTGGSPAFFAIKVQSFLEIGTVHKNIAERAGAAKVYAAGELRKEGQKISANVMSGTYSCRIIERHPNRSNSLINTTVQHLESMGLDVKVLPCGTILKPESIPVQKDELELYNSIGCEIKMFKTKGDCNTVTQYPTMINIFKNNIVVFEKQLKDARERFEAMSPNDTRKKYIEADIARYPALIEAEEKKLEKLHDDFNKVEVSLFRSNKSKKNRVNRTKRARSRSRSRSKSRSGTRP